MLLVTCDSLIGIDDKMGKMSNRGKQTMRDGWSKMDDGWRKVGDGWTKDDDR